MALPDLRDFCSALIVKPSSLGDIVHTLPAVHAIRAAHPHLKLRWIAKPEWMPLLEGSSDIDEVIPFPQKDFRGIAGAAKASHWAMQWNKEPREVPEIVFDFQGLMRSALISFARGSRPIIGLSDAREGASGFYDHIVPVNPGAHAVDRYLELPRAFGVPVDRVEFPMPEGQPVEQALPASFVLVHPYSRGEGKSLGHHELQVLCDCLTTVPIVVVGMTRQPQPLRGKHVIDLTNGTTLPQLIALMRRAAVVVSVDSGPMHIAAAVNDLTLGLHTWSDPRKVGPYNPNAWVWKAGRIAHRGDFTAEECERSQAIHEGDARRIADFVMA